MENLNKTIKQKNTMAFHVKRLLPLTFSLLIFLGTMFPSIVTAQCAVPTSVTFSTTDAACFGASSITVLTVNNAPAPDNGTMRYQLVYDSANSTNNLQIVKDWQASPVFTQVGDGSYFINVQQICSGANGGISDSLQSAVVTVNSTASALDINAVNVLKNVSTCSNNGSFNVTVTGGSGNYTYALINSLNEAEPITDYVAPPQASDTFSNRAVGTYYVRVYDACGYYATAPVTLNTVGDNNLNWMQVAAPQTTYSCDSISTNFFLNNYNGNPTVSGNPDSAERMWTQIGVNGIADTLTGWTWLSSVVSFSKTYYFTSYPDTIYAGYKSACGTVLINSQIIQQPAIQIQYSSLGTVASNCGANIIQFQLKDSANPTFNNTPYYNGKISIDSGRTWSEVNTTGNTFTDTLQAGQTYFVWATSSCGDTAKIELSIPEVAIALQLAESNILACPGNSGFDMQVSNYSGDASQILFTVLKQPDGADLPESWYDSVYQTGSSNGIPYIDNAQYTYNLPIGEYIIQAQDGCGNSAIDTITITEPMIEMNTIQLNPNCSTASQNGFTLTYNLPNYIAVSSGILTALSHSITVIVTNTATGETDSTYNNNIGFSSITATVNGTTLSHGMNLSAGTYNVKVVNGPWFTSPQYLLPIGYYPACSWDTTITITSGGALNASMLATSSCNGGTSSTIAVSVTGGSGAESYTYQLQSVSGSDTTNVGAAQNTGIFNGLSASTQYNVKITDTCGRSINYKVSISNAPLYLTFSTVALPCTGDVFSMILPTVDGATYAWMANDTIIPGATTNEYTVTVPSADTVVTYVGEINLGNDCLILSQPYTLNPADCASSLPVTGFQLSAQVEGNNDVLLTWGTTTEINSKNFTVQRSADGGKTWIDVGTIATKAVNGNSSIPLSYQLTDSYVPVGNYEYRVVETNMDGNTANSNIVPIQITAGAKIYPIPASTYVRIVLPAGVSNATYRMISTDGKIVLSGTMSNQGNYGQISVSELASAVYFLQITVNNVMQTYEVQVQH